MQKRRLRSCWGRIQGKQGISSERRTTRAARSNSGGYRSWS